MDLNVLALIATIVFILIALFLIPVLLQIKNTVHRMELFMADIQRDLTPLLEDLRETTKYVRNITMEAQRDMEKVGPVFDSLEEAGTMVNNIAGFLNSGVTRTVGKSVGTWMGLRAARKAFGKQLKLSKGR